MHPTYESRDTFLLSPSFALVVASAFAACISIAHADVADVTMRFDALGASETTSISFDDDDTSLGAGPLDWIVVSSDHTGFGLEQAVRSFCIELDEGVSRNATVTFEVVDLAAAGYGGGMGADRAAWLEELFGRFYDVAFSAQDGTAFQLAVWELVHDDARRLETGAFAAEAGATRDRAQGWLDQLDGTGPHAGLVGMRNDGAQDQVAVMAVPAPGAAMLLIMGGCRTRRRRD